MLGSYKKYKVTIDNADVTASVTNAIVFQDLQSPTWSAQIFFLDSSDLLNFLPIRTGSSLNITVATEHGINTDGENTFNFIIYRIADKVSQNQKTQFYVLHCVPLLFMVNQSLRINKSFTNIKMLDAIHEMWIENMTDMSLETGNCDNSSHLILTNTTLFIAIGRILRQTYKNNTADFLFYQSDNNTYSCNSIDEMYTSNRFDTECVIFMKPAEIRKNGDFVLQYQYNILKFEFQHYDTALNLSQGFYKNKLVTYDFFTKKKDEKVFSYGDDKPEDLVNKDWDDTNKIFNSEDSNVSFLPKSSEITEFNNSCNDSEMWLQSRKQSLLKLEQEILLVQVPGSIGIYKWLGKTVYVEMPSQSDLNTENFDRKRTGKYLVTAISHYLNANGYVCNLELIKKRLEE